MSDIKSITSSLSRRSYSYSINEKLGSGSFAEVFKGVIDDTQETIAIKVISKSIIQKYGPEIRNAIGNEVNVLQKISLQIKTPYIVRIYECFETANNIYIILEFCNNGTLSDILKTSKTLAEKESLVIIYQIVLALVAMDSKGIAHRDIKPENIFINEGIYKIGDFGFAAQKGMFQTTLGTYPYMAPEIFQNKEYNNKVDVWAVGVMLHEMLFGELYFIGSSHMEVANNVQKKKYELKQPCHLSADTQDFLIRCLNKNPSSRISAVEMLSHKAFDQIRNLPQFRVMQSQAPQPVKDKDEALEAKMLIDNQVMAIAFLEKFADKLGYLQKIKANFSSFYLYDEAYKQLVSLKNFFVNGRGNFINGFNENKQEIFKKSKYYDRTKKEIEDYFNKLQKKYESFINDFSYKIDQEWPREKEYLLLFLNNSRNIDIETLYKEELKSLKLKVIKEGEDYRRNNQKELAKESFTMAYELSVAIEIKKMLYEQFDFISFENNLKNLNFEDIMKQL